MTFDYKEKYKEFYLPKTKPEIVTLPPMNYIAVTGEGNPNEEDGSYKKMVGILYAIAYTIKMSHKSSHKINGFFQYVVPPLEGFWWQHETEDSLFGVDYAQKENFHWISVIRLPDFVTKEDFAWAVNEAGTKKDMDCSVAEFITIEEGLCVQIMHIGSFDNEPQTVEQMNNYIQELGFENDLTDRRLHHEIYLSDPRKTQPEKCKTVIRHPIKKCKGNQPNLI